MKPSKFPNLFYRQAKRKHLYTKNLTPGVTFFEERTRKGMRNLDPRRSKLGAAIIKGISQIGIKEGDSILYLGASHGYTPSFISDMVGEKGFVYAVDFAPRVMRDLVMLSMKRKNIAPIMADANQPDHYSSRILMVDVVYQDVAQKNQAEIFLKNIERFLKPGGFGLLAVKSRSIDITKKPKAVFSQVRQELEKNIAVVDYRELDPLEKDHAMFVVKKSL